MIALTLSDLNFSMLRKYDGDVGLLFGTRWHTTPFRFWPLIRNRGGFLSQHWKWTTNSAERLSIRQHSVHVSSQALQCDTGTRQPKAASTWVSYLSSVNVDDWRDQIELLSLETAVFTLTTWPREGLDGIKSWICLSLSYLYPAKTRRWLTWNTQFFLFLLRHLSNRISPVLVHSAQYDSDALGSFG